MREQSLTVKMFFCKGDSLIIAVSEHICNWMSLTCEYVLDFESGTLRPLIRIKNQIKVIEWNENRSVGVRST